MDTRTLDAAVDQVRELRKQGMTYAKIDQELGFPKEWQGRGSWVLAHRPDPTVPIPPAAPTMEPDVPIDSTQHTSVPLRVKPKRFCPDCGRMFKPRRKHRSSH